MSASTRSTESKQTERSQARTPEANQRDYQPTPAAGSQSSLLSLHRTIGNHAFGQVLQAKLAISSPGDVYERDADRVAEQVMSDSNSGRVSGPSVTQSLKPDSISRKCVSCGNQLGEQRTCADCRKENGQVSVQRSAINGQAATEVPQTVHSTLRVPGHPLDSATLSLMEQRFGRDLSSVRIHSGSLAEQSAKEINAHAYTVGQDIVFGASQYAPHTERGLYLLSHELAHVIQQGAADRRTSFLALDLPGSSLDLQADQMASLAMAGQQTESGGALSAPSGLVLRHAADKTICPPPPAYTVVSAAPRDVYGPANEAIEQAYLTDSRHKNHTILTGGQFEYGGNKEIRLPRGASNRKAGDAVLSRLRGLVRQRAPDIMNFTERVFYEIKTPRFAAGGMVQLESYYALTEAIRIELGEEGGPPWDPGSATWYPPHVLPFPKRQDRLICTQMTDYSVTTPGLILYTVLEKQKKEEDKEKQAQEVAKPEQKQEEAEKTKTQQSKAMQEDEGEGEDTKVPWVAYGAGGAALTAGAIAILRKRAKEQAAKRAAQLAWRKMLEAAAARKAAQAAGKGVAGKAAGKAVLYAEVAAAAALAIFYSDRVEAKIGPGPSAIETLYKAMTSGGTPPSPELKKLIESDPLLKQLAEEAGTSGDARPLQQEITRRTLEMIRNNPNMFSPEDLDFLMQYSKTADASGQAPETVEQLRKAIDAAKAGKSGTQQKGAPTEKGNTNKKEEKKDVLDAEETRLIVAIRKDEKLKKIYDTVFGPTGFRVDKATLERLLALKTKLDARPEMVEVILRNSVKGEITDPLKQLIEPMEQLVTEAEKQKNEPKKDATTAEGQPGTIPTDPKKREKAEGETDVAVTGPTDAEKATATPVEFWKHFDDKRISPSNIKVEPDSTELPDTTSVPLTLKRQTAKGQRVYKTSMHGTLKKKLDTFDTKKFKLAGTYEFSAPLKIVKSEQGDEPIYFTDTNTLRSLTWGILKGKSATRASSKKK